MLEDAFHKSSLKMKDIFSDENDQPKIPWSILFLILWSNNPESKKFLYLWSWSMKILIPRSWSLYFFDPMVSLTYFFIYNQKKNISRNILYKVQKWSFSEDLSMVMNGNTLDFRQSGRFHEKRGIWWNPQIRVSWTRKNQQRFKQSRMIKYVKWNRNQVSNDHFVINKVCSKVIKKTHSWFHGIHEE